MNKTRRQRLAACVGALGEAFRQKVTEATAAAYEMALDDIEIERIERAVKTAMRDSEFFPSAHEIRTLAGEMTPDARAVLAWEEFSKAVQRVGYYRSLDFDDKVINAVCHNLGGWMRCCDLPAEEFDKWLRKDFERVYVQLFNSGIGDEQAAPLLGYFEKENRSSGAAIPAGMELNCGGKPILVVTGLPALPSHVLRLTNRKRSGAGAVQRIELKKP